MKSDFSKENNQEVIFLTKDLDAIRFRRASLN